MAETNGWDQYQKLVIDKLGEHDEKITSIESKLLKIEVDYHLFLKVYTE